MGSLSPADMLKPVAGAVLSGLPCMTLLSLIQQGCRVCTAVAALLNVLDQKEKTKQRVHR